VELSGYEMVFPGQTSIVNIGALDGGSHTLKIGSIFTIWEGHRAVGQLEIT
jgi:hypothetical protein